jgi:hypothetical protein
MRSHLLARRIIFAPALSLALVAALAACASSTSSSTVKPSPSPSPSAVAAAQIKANWEKFFSYSTPVSEKVPLLQNGSTFSSAIKDFASLPLASGVGATVTKVVVTSPTQATVTYNITSSGTTLLPGQTAKAVYQNGTWKVGDASLCGLFKLIPGGTVPSACKSVS